MASSAAGTTLVSAPGKVLVAGGYLVLDPAYPGLVIATDSRFYTHVTPAQDAQEGRQLVRVRSPQFIGARWDYVVAVKQDTCSLQQTSETHAAANAGPNPFISLAVLYALRLAVEVRGSEHVASVLAPHGLDIAVLADNDFYSQRQGAKAPSRDQLAALPTFHAQECAIRDVHKTGLGSSAAMTTSLVGALLLHLGAVGGSSSSSSERQLSQADLALVHNTAQLAHCAAQGKVGSGFDVSSAVWGSHLYRRFDPLALQPLLDAGEKVGVEGGETSSSAPPALLPHLSPSNALWHPSPLSSEAGAEGSTNPTAVEGLHSADPQGSSDGGLGVARPAPLELPPRLEMVLADVDTGSNTPSLVGKVMAWRKAKPEWAAQLYAVIAASNSSLADALLALRLAHAQDPQAYDEAVENAAKHKVTEWDSMQRGSSPSTTLVLLIEVRNALRSIRAGMRELGQRAGAPVEPDEMGRVIRASVDGAPGVLGGGVPGAGGFDALYLLYLRPASVPDSQPAPARVAVEAVWADWTELSIGPLLSTAGGSAGVASSAEQLDSAAAPAQQHPDLPRLPSSSTRDGGLRVESVQDVKGLQAALVRPQR